MNRAALVPGILLIALGSLFLLDALDVVDAGSAISDWWPLAIVAIGLFRFFDRPPDRMGGSITAAIGLVVLAFTQDVIDGSAFAYLWPAALIGVGLWVLVGRRSAPAYTEGDDTVSAVVLFSGRELAPRSPRFAGGSLFAAFGGIDLDLRDSQPQAGGAHIDATVMFGGCDVKVPPGWRVTMSGPAIFGGYDNEADSGPLPDDAPSLNLRVLALFGGVDVKADASGRRANAPS